ncbi:MAG: helicase-related protein [Spirochaetota bacterium]
MLVDEQHRFGVAQRLALKNKAPEAPHVLLMSATPIPRTLALTLYGDLEISSIDTMPQERKVIQTHLVRKGNDSKLYEFIRGELAASRQAYFICPLIDEDEELRSVEQMQAELESVFPQYPLAVVHGRMSPEQKYAAMDAFRAGKVRILLATTVVEVGIDVASASVIAIEHAERFGLAQLHQLRGRVGRGLDQGYCFLVYENEGLSSLAKERLMTLKNCHDGFAIAEKDLELRGPGDLLGKDQSGCMELRIAEIPADLECLEYARRDAVELLERDFGLLQAENQGLRQALLGKDSLDA